MNIKQSAKNLAVKVKNVNYKKCGRWAVIAAFVLIAIVIAGLTLSNSTMLVDQGNKLDDVIGRVNTLETDTGELKGKSDRALREIEDVRTQAAAANKSAARSNARHDKRVTAENQELKKHLAYIRGANPGFPLATKSAEEINKLLTNGVWDVEKEIADEYERLQAANVASVKLDAEAAQESARNAEYVAAKALDAGGTAIAAVSAIASQPTKRFGKSVGPKTKRTISASVEAYIERWSGDARIKEGAPEE